MAAIASPESIGYHQPGFAPELIELPAGEQAEMMQTLSRVGEDLSKDNPALHDALAVVTDAANRTRQAAGR